MKHFVTLLFATSTTMVGAQNLNSVTYTPNPVHECEVVTFTLHGNYPSSNYTPVNMIFTPGANTLYFAASGTGTSPQTNFNEAANPVGPFGGGPQSVEFYLMLNGVIVDSLTLNFNVIAAVPFDPGISTYGDSICPAGPPFPLISQLGGTPSTGGSWLAPGGAPHGPSFVPGTDPAGIYTYVFAPPLPCPTVASEVQIIYRPGNNPGFGQAFSICVNGDAVNLQDSLGGSPFTPGTWTGPGGSASTGIYDPTVNNPGIYTYTVPAILPCTVGNSTNFSITEAALPNAGTGSSVTICTTDTTYQLNDALSGTPDTTGSWHDPSNVMYGTWSAIYNAPISYPGIYTYVVHAANCTPDTAFVVITEQALPCGIGISEVIAGVSTFNVRPNPADGLITIEITFTEVLGQTTLEVIDMTGTILRRDKLEAGGRSTIAHSMDLRDVPSGAYFIRLTSDRGTIARRFMLR